MINLKEKESDEDDEYADDYDDNDAMSMAPEKFKIPKMHSFGLNGRSASTQRKAMGKKGNEAVKAYVCTNCGAEYVNWVGKCTTCHQWNAVQEFKVGRSPSSSFKPRASFMKGSPMHTNEGSVSKLDGSWFGDVYSGTELEPIRMTDLYQSEDTKDRGSLEDMFRRQRLQVPENEEFNNVLGGGFMSGSLTLLGGDPGVGKSTLLLQVAGAVASLSTPSKGIGMGLDDEETTTKSKGPVMYISGEENAWQIANRAYRLGIDQSELFLLCDTDADTIAEMVANPKKGTKLPSLVVIDSIQTMMTESGGSSSAGGVTQVRESVALFLRLAKSTGIPIVLVGHVTKSGDVAGPKTVEHMVDCVLYLEGDRTQTDIRMLRSTKNRFGSSDEVGVYEMDHSPLSGGRLIPVSDPSSFFLSERRDNADSEGCAVSLILEGSRPVTAEVQALVAWSHGSNSCGRRTVDGISTSRLLLILAVLDKRFGISFSRQDVYVNVVGGIRLSTGASKGSESDLAVAAALVSSATSNPVRADSIFLGEIGLSGELRPIPNLDKRIAEAKRMGFSRIITPPRNKRRKPNSEFDGIYKPKGEIKSSNQNGIQLYECVTVLEAMNAGLVQKLRPKKRKKTTRN